MVQAEVLPDATYGLQLCTACKGVGFVRADLPVEHPLFGKPVPCKKCGKQAQIALKALQCMTVLPEDLVAMDADWDTFPRDEHGNLLVDLVALERMKTYARLVAAKQNTKRGIVLRGKNQIGKTGMAYCAHKQIEAAGVPSVFIGAIDFFDRMQAAQFHQDPERALWLMDKFATVSHLVIDDLGSEKTTEKREEWLFSLFNRRTKNPKTTTLITTNCDLNDEFQEKLGAKVYSRITGHSFSWIKVNGEMNCLTGGF
jgi:DNA replication protein DnaC